MRGCQRLSQVNVPQFTWHPLLVQPDAHSFFSIYRCGCCTPTVSHGIVLYESAKHSYTRISHNSIEFCTIIYTRVTTRILPELFAFISETHSHLERDIGRFHDAIELDKANALAVIAEADLADRLVDEPLDQTRIECGRDDLRREYFQKGNAMGDQSSYLHNKQNRMIPGERK